MNLTLYICSLDLIWYLDPGESNIFFMQGRNGHGTLLEDKHTMILTRGRFYELSKINACNRRANKWNKTIATLINGMSEHHFKTTDLNALEDSIQFYYNNFHTLWARKGGSKKWERQNLFLYGSKKRVVHRFLNSLRRQGYRDPIIRYGDGEFPGGRRGARYVPCKWVKRECSLFYHTILVNEFRTSQVCPVCDARLYDVRKHYKNGKIDKVRGLKWCASDVCKACPLKSRDEVGCINIYRKTLPDYPAILDRPGAGRGVRWLAGPEVYEFRPPH